MPKRFPLLRILGLLAAVSCTFATLAVAAQVAPQKQEKAKDESGLIVLDVTPSDKKGQLPPVVFDHNQHTKNDTAGDSCASCHDTATPRKTGPFKGTEGKTGKDLENAFHTSCIACHEDLKAKKKPTGPLKAECRSCHDAAKLPAQKTDKKNKVDGGFDASLHARHVASPLIIGPDGTDNCSACHHPVKQKTSPRLKADSCRSCHAAPRANKGEDKKPAFADTAHNTCISCHIALAPSGVKGPVTCAACHDAATKAGYTKLQPVPRLRAGQPDKILMGAPPSPRNSDVPMPPTPLRGKLPDPILDAKAQPQPGMPPVVFDHKKHEVTTESCITCHHKTMQRCSSCHTPTGSPKGGNVSAAKAMHLKTSDKSCVGCHEARKKATPECAGCHAILPKVHSTQTSCAACHVPSTRSAASSGRQASSPPLLPQVSEQAPPTLESVIAAAPEKVRIDALAKEYEPAIFAHRDHIKKLAEGITETAPGMMRFHADPYTLCASCHHVSPISASPPSCASCHDKETASLKQTGPASTKPLLKAAYHQQCMTCHTAMRVTQAASTDCAACHTARVKGKR